MVAAPGGAWQVANASEEARPPFLFGSLGLAQGLPSNDAQAMAEDAGGDLWLATGSGLARYDGHRVVPWTPAGLAGQGIENLLVDRDDRLWLGVVEGGLARLERDRRSLTRWRQGSPAGWPADDIWALLQDRHGRLLVGTFGHGLIALDPDSGRFEQHELGNRVSVTELLETSDGSVWIATFAHGLHRRRPDGGFESVAQAAIGSDPIHTLVEYQGQIWLGLRHAGLCRLAAPDTDALDCEAWPELPADARGVLALRVSPDGQELWVSRRNGLSLRQADAHWLHLRHRPGTLGSLPAAQPWKQVFDSHGGLWIATLGGGFAHLSPLARHTRSWVPDPLDPQGLSAMRVRGISVAAGQVHLATMDDGVLQLDLADGRFERVPKARLQGTGRALAVLARDEGLWVGHDAGLSLLGSTDRHWPLADFGVHGGGMVDLLAALDSGQILAAVQGKGLFVMRPEQRPLPVATRKPPSRFEQFLHDEQLWVASEQGLHHYDADCSCLRDWALPGERVYALARQADGNWWLALAGRLQRYAGERGPERLQREVDWPLLPPGGLAADRQGRLWVAGPTGLAVLEPAADKLRWLTASLGPIATGLSDRPFLIDGERFWIGADQGLLQMEPEALRNAPLPRRLQIEEISLRRGSERLRLDAERPGRLDAGDAELQIRARVPLLQEATALHLRSRIDGWDPDWVELVDGVRSIGTLPPGQYRLLLEAWHPAHVDTRLQRIWPFEVLPPWWRSTPFLVSMVALVALLGWLWQRRQRLRLQAAHELELHRRQAQWAESEAIRSSNFLAELSHEIRNPLSGLLGLLRQAEADPAAAGQRPRLALIRSAGQQISALVEDVLVHARGDQLPLRVEALALDALLVEAADRHRPQAQARGLALRLAGAAGLCVRGDRTRILQVLDNLLGNALKFTEHGAIDIEWKALGNELLIWLQDDGPGVPAALQERIFDQRDQIQADGRGLGLGLAIARQLARAMGGELSLVPSPHGRRGARFELRLPACEPGQDGAQPDTGRHTRPCTRSWLLVEDDPLQRAALLHELQAAGVRIEGAADALTALTSLAIDPDRALLTDLGLPEVDGLSLIRLARAQDGERRRPILVLTARALPADRAAAFEAGADTVLAKPIEPQDLLREMGKWDLEGPRA